MTFVAPKTIGISAILMPLTAPLILVSMIMRARSEEVQKGMGDCKAVFYGHHDDHSIVTGIEILARFVKVEKEKTGSLLSVRL